MNTGIIDVKIQPDVKLFDEIVNFNVSAKTGVFTLPDGTQRPRYTFIRVIYPCKVTDSIRQLLQAGKFVRIYYHFDSEQYVAKSGKTVYNKILVADKITAIKYDKESDDYIEVGG